MVMDEREPRRRPEPLIDLAVPRRWHLVGIGGPGMAPLAHLLRAAGQLVSGSDLRESASLAALRRHGVTVTVGHSAESVIGVEVVVFSTAVPPDNVELRAARDAGLRVCHRAVALASVCDATRAFGVAGAHGKTTTSALVAAMLRETGVDTASYVGADVLGDDSQATDDAPIGDDTILVVEADESDGTIEVLPLRGIAVTNIDRDHLDYWGDLDGLVAGFVDVVEKVIARGGIAVLNADDARSSSLGAGRPDGTVRRFGWSESSDVRIAACRPTDDGVSVELVVDGEDVSCRLPLRGVHNASNLACAVAVATSLGASVSACVEAAEKFAGVERRFHERATVDGAVVIDDYAHLPAEIAASLAAAREHPRLDGNLVAVFQPNRYHRIAAMAGEYADCFSSADHVVITDIYASGTQPIEGVTGKLVADAVAAVHPSVVWAPTRRDVVEAVMSVLGEGDICIGMGCGDIATLAGDLRSAT